MIDREVINEYDLGLPVPMPPLEERICRVPDAVWRCLRRAKEALTALLGTRLAELKLFGSYARAQFVEDSDVDVLVLLADEPTTSERNAILHACFEASRGDWEVVLSPLIMSQAELDDLRARERILALDIDREGIPL